jgi:hypothetical protein
MLCNPVYLLNADYHRSLIILLQKVQSTSAYDTESSLLRYQDLITDNKPINSLLHIINHFVSNLIHLICQTYLTSFFCCNQSHEALSENMLSSLCSNLPFLADPFFSFLHLQHLIIFP